MNNQELTEALSLELTELLGLNEEAIKIARDVIGETLFKTDLYFCALLNKSIQLTDGFIEMIQNRNLTCAGILLRVCMDNCLRMYSICIAADANEVVDCLVSGKRIDYLTDKNGKKLRDAYLKEELGKYDDRFIQVYNNASGYVHFSEKGFYQSVSVLQEEYHIGIQVSHLMPEKANEFILECIQGYTHFLKMFYKLFTNIIRAKKEYDKVNEEV